MVGSFRCYHTHFLAIYYLGGVGVSDPLRVLLAHVADRIRLDRVQSADVTPDLTGK